VSGLAASNIVVAYGRNVAVDDVSLEVTPGRIVGLIGPNGAGKTSFIDAVSGLTRLQSGVVSVDGVDVTSWPAHRRAARGMRRTFQQLRLFDDLTVRENLVVATERDSRLGFVRDLVRPRAATIATDRALAMTNLTHLADELPRNLPAGTRRLVGVARAVAAEPSVLLLDEPAAGLDTHETAELGDVLVGLADSGAGLLLVEHDTELVFRVSHHVVALDFGVAIASGPPEDVRRSAALIAAYLGVPDDEVAAASGVDVPALEADQAQDHSS